MKLLNPIDARIHRSITGALINCCGTIQTTYDSENCFMRCMCRQTVIVTLRSHIIQCVLLRLLHACARFIGCTLSSDLVLRILCGSLCGRNLASGHRSVKTFVITRNLASDSSNNTKLAVASLLAHWIFVVEMLGVGITTSCLTALRYWPPNLNFDFLLVLGQSWEKRHLFSCSKTCIQE